MQALRRRLPLGAGAFAVILLLIALVLAVSLGMAAALAWAITVLFGVPGVSWGTVFATWIVLLVLGAVLKPSK